MMRAHISQRIEAYHVKKININRFSGKEQIFSKHCKHCANYEMKLQLSPFKRWA